MSLRAYDDYDNVHLDSQPGGDKVVLTSEVDNLEVVEDSEKDHILHYKDGNGAPSRD